MKSQEIQPKIEEFNRLQDKGWSVRKAAEKIGVSYSHVYYVLRGVRESSRVLSKLEALPNMGPKLHRGRKARAFHAAFAACK